MTLTAQDLEVLPTPAQARLLLVDDGLLTRVEYQQRPVRHEYRLTDKGRDAYPILAAMADTGGVAT